MLPQKKLILYEVMITSALPRSGTEWKSGVSNQTFFRKKNTLAGSQKYCKQSWCSLG